jgi:hypothetical protein
VEEKDPPHALFVLTPIALGAVGLLASLDDFCVLTVRTLHPGIETIDFLLARFSGEAIVRENY